MTWIDILELVAAILLPNVGGFIAGFFFSNVNWYKELKKPAWSPPAWLFGPAWTLLYSAIGYASYLVWRDGGGFEGAALPLALYAAQLVINWLWTPLFFGCKSTILGLVDFVFLYPTALAATYEFFRVDSLPGFIMVPYMLWLTFAFFLNFTIYRLNRGDNYV